MRQFIRHPAEIPIEVYIGDQHSHAKRYVHNLSLGGLSFQSDRPIDSGMIVDVRIDFVRPAFETKARVAWCCEHDDGYELGVEFLSADDAFRGRMVEQVCHIENYKNEVFQIEGRELSVEEAAMEWIGKYASQFPETGPERTQ